MVKRFPILRGAGAVCLCFLVLPCRGSHVATGKANGPPNIVVILVDDLGWADLRGYGSDLHDTPRIDRLGREGMRFTDAYAASCVCSPTRASIMTGKYPARLHMTIWYGAAVDPEVNKEKNPKLITPQCEHNLPHHETTIAEALGRAGYFTAHVGKWHLGDPSHYPRAHGFDVNVGGTFSGCPASFFSPFFDADRNPLPSLPADREGEYLTDRLTREAIAILEKAGSRPLFLHLAYYTVHTPIEGKPKLVDRYARRVKPGFEHRNPAYAAMVHSLDENVGRLLDKLDELGIADRTAVILFSDNGGAHYKHRGRTITSNQPLRAGKGTLYEGGVRVPLVVRWPGVTPAGSVCRRPVISQDLYPTILEIAGLEGDPGHNAEVDGLSLVPLLRDPTAALARDALYWHYPHYYYGMNTPGSSIRCGHWKLLEYIEDGRIELYNLEDDLGETRDLSAVLPDRARQLRDRLDAWRKRVDAQMPEPNPNYRP